MSKDQKSLMMVYLFIAACIGIIYLCRTCETHEDENVTYNTARSTTEPSNNYPRFFPPIPQQKDITKVAPTEDEISKYTFVLWSDIEKELKDYENKTDFQREAAENRFRGKPICWSGVIHDVQLWDGLLGDGRMHINVTMRDELYSDWDVTLDVPSDGSINFETVSKGDSIIFYGVFDDFTSSFSFVNVANGQIGAIKAVKGGNLNVYNQDITNLYVELGKKVGVANISYQSVANTLANYIIKNLESADKLINKLQEQEQ